jgi:DNA polymerase-3 subunit alpha
MGFAGYFLIVWDFIRYAQQEAIPVGPGRGSAAGSLVAYALRITDIDPLQYQLLFERFLNPERVSLPDIDIDFCMRRRGDVIQYVANKYGRDHVAQIITFGTLAAKAVVRDVGRVMGIPYAKVDRVAKLIPDMTRSLAQAAREVDELAAEVANDPEVSQIVNVGSRLEGLTRHASLHAAGVVIAPRPIEELVPLYKTSKDEIVTQWDKDVIEDLGFLKMDFLGLRTLTVIDDTLRLLAHQGSELDLDEVPLDDAETFRLFCEGRTSGVFQFESAGMKDLLRRAAPSRFEDLAAMNALYRPGALSVGMVEEYIQRKLGKRRVSYVIPETARILEETYGIIAYQEQVMQIAVEIAGFSMGEADVLRKAMGKKSPEVMARQKEKFVVGASERGYDRSKAAALWEFIEPFAGYGFNKSHSVAYAMLAYKTAYLKAHHPVPFMAAMLTSEMSSKDNVAKYISECLEMGIPVKPPDVNESEWSFSVHGEGIRFGLGAVKGLGDAAVEAILAARRRLGRFRGLVEFVCEVDPRCLNQKVLEALVKSGCFDGFGLSRQALARALPEVVSYAQRRWREQEIGQETLFGGGAQLEPRLDDTVPEWPERQRLVHEKEALGFYLTGNPLAEHAKQLRSLATHTISELDRDAEGPVTVGGLVTSLKRVTIKSGPNAGRIMGRFTLEDLGGRMQVAVFADQMQRFGGVLTEDAAVLVRGVVRDRGSDVELSVEEIRSLDGMLGDVVTLVEVVMERPLETRSALELRDLLTERSGQIPVVFRVRLPDCDVTITSGERYRIEPDEELTRSIERILGPGCVHCRMQPVSSSVH